MLKGSGSEPLDVLIVGPLPPPFGGVATHVQKLNELLGATGLRVGVLNHYRSPNGQALATLNRNPLRYLVALARFKSRLVHYHHSRWSTLLAVAATRRFRKGSRYVMTLHGQELNRYVRSRRPFVAPLTRWALDRFDEIVAVSEEVASGLRPHVRAANVSVIPAFLGGYVTAGPPLEPEEEAFFAGGAPTLVVPASRIKLVPDRGDVYGLDLAVAAFIRLAPAYDDLRLALFIARPPRLPRERRYVRRLEDELSSEAPGRTGLFVDRPLAPAFKHSIVLVRPSRSDGDAVSIREALAAGAPVLASDVVRRPDGTHLFTAENPDELVASLKALIDGAARAERARGPGSEAKSLLGPLAHVYDRQLAGGTRG